MKKYIVYIAVSAFALSALSCTKSFEEVNTDPDRPAASIVPATNVLAYAERFASDNLFDEWFDLNESSGFSGQIAKWMYTEEGYYDFRPNVNNNSWAICFLTASNLQSIIDRVDKGSNMWAAATIFQCNIYQIASDRWGNIPYSEACKLSAGIPHPKYDKQSEIYPDLLNRLKEAVAALDENGDDLGVGDVMLNGDIALWKKYGNALRLKIAARIAAIDPDNAQTAFTEIAAAGIPENNDDNIFFEAWGNEYGEPWADYYRTRQNEYGVSTLLVKTLNDLSDPRLPVYANPTANFVNGVAGAPQYAGYPIGKKEFATVAACSKLGDRFMGKDASLKGFSPWLRSCEPYFAISYAASKGWDAGMTQKEAYEKAVTLSLEENDVDAADIAAYLAGPGAYDGSQEQLFTQWWIALFKNGQEAWSVYRMSGYPAGNAIAVDSKYPDHDVPPMSYSYPDTEANLNNANYAPEAAAEIDYFWGKKMWWDVRALSARDYTPAP